MNLKKLTDIMSKLRGNNGCEWDKKQTHETLKRFFIEETYEVIDAIEKKDMSLLKEELGDVLLQVVFHTQLASEKNIFNIDDVIEGVCEKLIRRHPHVFNKNQKLTPVEVEKQWEKIKQQEKLNQNMENKSILDGVPNGMPSTLQAIRVTEKASRVGFDWENLDGVLDKIDEELQELKNEIKKKKNKKRIYEELGDLFFSISNLSRHLDIDPEDAHKYTINKFKKRFAFIEKYAKNTDKEMSSMDINELESLWQKAKKEE